MAQERCKVPQTSKYVSRNGPLVEHEYMMLSVEVEGQFPREQLRDLYYTTMIFAERFGQWQQCEVP